MEKYLITGATGYIGSLITEYLIQQGNKVVVIIRNVEKLNPLLKEKVEIIIADIRDTVTMEHIVGQYDYIIHCAAPTRSTYMISNPVEVADSIVNGTQNILQIAKRSNVKGMVYLSSMEVYGQINCSNGRKVSENELGEINITNIRSCYPLAKRMAEHYCSLYYNEYGVPVKVARLAQTFGRGGSTEDNRVFAQFAKAVCNQRDIVLHTKGNSVGNYCDVDDAISGILYLLKHGEAGQAYNIVNEANTMTIHEMAEMVAEKIASGKIQVVFDIPKDNIYGYAPVTGLRLSGAKMKALGWEAKICLEEMYQKLINCYKL